MNKIIIGSLLFALSICSVCFARSDNQFDGVPQVSVGAHEQIQSYITAKQMLEGTESAFPFSCVITGNTTIKVFQKGYNYSWNEFNIELPRFHGRVTLFFPADKNTHGYRFTKSIYIQTMVDNTKVYGTCYYSFPGK